MNKITRNLAFLFFSILTISLIAGSVSAGYYGSYSPYDDYNENYYKETKTINSQNVDYNYYPGGYEKVTRNIKDKTVIEKVDYPHYRIYPRYQYYQDNYYPYSSFRYKEPYNYRYYGEDNYGSQYYYEPRYDWHLGYYNWRY